MGKSPAKSLLKFPLLLLLLQLLQDIFSPLKREYVREVLPRTSTTTFLGVDEQRRCLIDFTTATYSGSDPSRFLPSGFCA